VKEEIEISSRYLLALNSFGKFDLYEEEKQSAYNSRLLLSNLTSEVNLKLPAKNLKGAARKKLILKDYRT
jgi:hypothetical protein